MRFARLVVFWLGVATSAVVFGAEVTIDGLRPPEGCQSDIYKWTGERFECLEIDRVSILLFQRNSNMQALSACREEVKFLRGRAALDLLHQQAAEKCRKLGKVFDTETVDCGGAIGEQPE